MPEAALLFKTCCICDAEFTRRENEHDYLWENRTVCSTPCGITAQIRRGRYYLHATRISDGAKWYVSTSYNHRTTAEYRHVIVSADGQRRLSDGQGKGGRITREWRKEEL